MMILVHHSRTTRKVRRSNSDNRRLNHINISCTRFFYRFYPHIEANKGCFHWIIGNALIIFDEGFPLLDESCVFLTLYTLKVVPCGRGVQPEA